MRMYMNAFVVESAGTIVSTNLVNINDILYDSVFFGISNLIRCGRTYNIN